MSDKKDLKENEVQENNDEVKEAQNTQDNETTNVKEQLKQKEQELEDITDRYKRILAEFENHKKRSQKEREGLYNMVLSDVVSAMLPILDNLENAAKVETKDQEYKKGIELVLKQFQDTLKSKGVEEIKTLGETFDPELHEAVSSVQDDTKGEKEIVQEYRKGYKIGTKVIRHSMVVVAN